MTPWKTLHTVNTIIWNRYVVKDCFENYLLIFIISLQIDKLVDMFLSARLPLVCQPPVLRSKGKSINSLPGLICYFWQWEEHTTCEHHHIFTTLISTSLMETSRAAFHQCLPEVVSTVSSHQWGSTLSKQMAEKSRVNFSISSLYITAQQPTEKKQEANLYVLYSSIVLALGSAVYVALYFHMNIGIAC